MNGKWKEPSLTVVKGQEATEATGNKMTLARATYFLSQGYVCHIKKHKNMQPASAHD
jgi:hypothetical protein